MNAEIVRAGALRPDDIIAYGKHILLVGEVDIDSTPGVAWVQIDGHVNKVAFDFDDWVPKLLPDPVEVREYWRCSYEWKRATPDCRIEWAESVHEFRAKIDAEERLDRAIKTHANGREIRKQRIEHVRETVLSRKEVKP